MKMRTARLISSCTLISLIALGNGCSCVQTERRLAVPSGNGWKRRWNNHFGGPGWDSNYQQDDLGMKARDVLLSRLTFLIGPPYLPVIPVVQYGSRRQVKFTIHIRDSQWMEISAKDLYLQINSREDRFPCAKLRRGNGWLICYFDVPGHRINTAKLTINHQLNGRPIPPIQYQSERLWAYVYFIAPQVSFAVWF